VDLWQRHGASGRAAYEAEARSIAALFQTPTARNLVRIFQLQDRLKGMAGRGSEAAPVRRVHVVGAGVMGGDIAAWCALRGLEVTLQDRTAEQVAPAIARAAELFAKRTRGEAERAAATARLVADVAGDGVGKADLVLEAIFENREAKMALYARIEPLLAPGAVLATNTSSIALESLAAGLARPSRLVGLHFFNPVAQMPLVEVIHGEGTDDAAVRAALAFAKRIDKLPLPCRSAPGFLVNRVLMPYLQEAMLALEEGVPAEMIDAVATGFGMPMGPLELADTVGLDVCKRVGEIVAEGLGRAPPVHLARIEALVKAGNLGRKTGQGFYRWQDGKPAKAATTGDASIPADLEDRLVLALVNESMACLREGIVVDADLVDAGVVFGTGFAPFRGGPLCWARAQGVAPIRDRLERLALTRGARFRPDEGWSQFS
jgi:3-hydroxyacyl-CoA dehydrogenase/enoyl-CoA hydratase/3-hydroxybutyryl-CoA epimerase